MREAGPVSRKVLDRDEGFALDDELIVLVDDAGRPIGTAPKLASHHRDTPLHLAFSSYVFGPDGRFLLTRRARGKKTWPGVWTNSCCGHPAPGEAPVDAVRRRLHEELGLEPAPVTVTAEPAAERAVGPAPGPTTGSTAEYTTEYAAGPAVGVPTSPAVSGAVVPLLPDFRYRAELAGVVENEVCPVYAVRVVTDPSPDPTEVEEYRWVDWDELVIAVTTGTAGTGAGIPALSPWAVLQITELVGHPAIEALRSGPAG